MSPLEDYYHNYGRHASKPWEILKRKIQVANGIDYQLWNPFSGGIWKLVIHTILAKYKDN